MAQMVLNELGIRPIPIPRPGELAISNFSEIAEQEFDFLRRELGYEIVELKEANDGGVVKYANLHAGIGIKLLYEFRSAFVFVFVYRLVDGRFCDNPLPIDDDTEINCFDFNDWLVSDRKMKPAYEYGESSVYYSPDSGLRNYVKDFAERLRSEGQAFLRGGLTMLPILAKIIENRANSSKHT